jgi:hypothetical protein
VEFTVDADKPVLVPIKSDKFREDKYLSEPIGGISFKSLCTPDGGHNNFGFDSNDTPPPYSDVQENEAEIAKTEL